MNRQGTILRTIPSFMDELQHRSQTRANTGACILAELRWSYCDHLTSQHQENELAGKPAGIVCVCVCRSERNGINMCNNGANPSQLSQHASAPHELPLIRARQDSHISWIQRIFFSSTCSCLSLALNHFPSVECHADVDVWVSG